MIFKGLSMKQITQFFFEGESPTLSTSSHLASIHDNGECCVLNSSWNILWCLDHVSMMYLSNFL